MHYGFIQVFPKLGSWENRIHYVVCENGNLEKELSLPQFKGTILSVEKLCEPMLIGNIPNDPIYTRGDMADLDLINANDAWAIAKNTPESMLLLQTPTLIQLMKIYLSHW